MSERRKVTASDIIGLLCLHNESNSFEWNLFFTFRYFYDHRQNKQRPQRKIKSAKAIRFNIETFNQTTVIHSYLKRIKRDLLRYSERELSDVNL